MSDRLDKLDKTVKTNSGRHQRANRRTLVLGIFVLFAFFLLAWRSEINTYRITNNTNKIRITQELTCKSTREVQAKFNRQQDALIAIERTNVDDPLRFSRIKAYSAARIDPLPICDGQGVQR